MDPNNQRARDGIERVEKHGDMGVDSSYDVEVEDMEGSDNEVSLHNLGNAGLTYRLVKCSCC